MKETKKQIKERLRVESEIEERRTYALLHPNKRYKVHFDEIVNAIINSPLGESQSLPVGGCWLDFKERMFEEFSRKKLQRHTLNNLETWMDIFRLGFKRRFRAQAETDNVIVSFEYFFSKEGGKFPISETWDFYNKKQGKGRKIIYDDKKEACILDPNPYSYDHNTEGFWRLEQ